MAVVVGGIPLTSRWMMHAGMFELLVFVTLLTGPATAIVVNETAARSPKLVLPVAKDQPNDVCDGKHEEESEIGEYCLGSKGCYSKRMTDSGCGFTFDQVCAQYSNKSLPFCRLPNVMRT